MRSTSDWVTLLRTSLSRLLREWDSAAELQLSTDYFCSDHKWYIESYIVRSSITVILIVWYCVGVFRLRDMASDDWADGDEAGPSYASSGPLPGTFLGPALDIQSDSLYKCTPELQDVIGLRAIRPDAAVAKVMSVRNSRCRGGSRIFSQCDRDAAGFSVEGTEGGYMKCSRRDSEQSSGTLEIFSRAIFLGALLEYNFFK